MPRVPYNPVPSVEPISPGEKIGLNVPGEAFGLNIGRAAEHLGTSIEGVGNKLFDRAMAFQDLNNENEARELQTKHAQMTAQIVADFDAMEGKSARDALPEHLKKLQAVRDQLAGSTSNPSVKRMFLNDTAGFMQRETFSAARHAGDEYRKYTIGNLNATQTLNLEGLRRYPENDKLFQDTLDNNDEINKQVLTAHGLPEDGAQAELLKKQSLSKAWEHRISGVNDTNPDKAAAMLEAHRGDLVDADYINLESRVKTQSRSISATNIANETMEWGKGEEGVKAPKSVEEMVDHARELAKERHPTDPMVEKHSVDVLHSLANTQNWEKTRQDITDRTAVETALADETLNIKTPQQLKAVPGMNDVLHRLGPKYENDLPARINRIQVSKSLKTREESFNRLEGLWRNDREEFLNTDMTKQGLSFTDLKYWTRKQDQAKEKVEDDPRVNRALATLRGSRGTELEDLHIFRRTESNKEDYDRFTGALSSAIDVWTQEKGKPPTQNEIRDEIGSNVIRTHATPGLFGMHNAVFGEDTPFYRQDLTTPAAQRWMRIKKDEAMAGGYPEPTDRQMEKAYVRYRYLEEYVKGKASTPKYKPGEVPN